ncbi:MAG: FIST C-terminal domain-containing protein [Synergistaceae bacterium]|nr:FIST C-terminal domain-containing protein [Synergistaceae bacterium]
MLKALTAYTSEIDDVEAAVSEILAQLDVENRLLANSVGLLTCYGDFIESGVVKALCDALPFEVAGSTTLGNVVPGATETMLLTLMVLTSDDVSFAVGLTEPFLSKDKAALRKGYESTLAKLGRRPSLIFSFVPLLMNAGGDFFVDALTEISGGVPNFGMLAVDHNSDYHESRVICNGEAHRERYALVLLAGDVEPGFFTGSISAEKIFREKGVVTASSGNQLQTVNDKPVAEYLRGIGLIADDNGMIVGINSFPFIVDYNDGTMPILRAIFAQTPEGYAVCGGDVPVGATLSVGSMNADEVIATTTEALSSALASRDFGCILMFSCVGRYFALGYEPMREIEKVRELMEGTGVPYQLTYSGGELCPVYETEKSDGFVTNRSHNNTLVVCVL